MKRISLFILSILSVLLNAQDTIYKRTGDIIPAKILEINTKEISYKRTDITDGPLFIMDKNEVKQIKYKTGAIDSFSLIKVSPPKSQLIYPSTVYSYNEQIQPSSRKGIFLYHGRALSDMRAMDLAMNKNTLWKSTELESEILHAKKNQKYQYISGFGGLGVAFLTVATTYVYSVNTIQSVNDTASAIIFFNGLGIVIASQILSVNFKIQRTRHTEKAVAIYNQHL